MTGSLSRWWEHDGTFICTRFIAHIITIDPHKSITHVVMFDGASNVHLAGELLKMHYPKISVMDGVENTVSLFFRDFSKISFVNNMITVHKGSIQLIWF